MENSTRHHRPQSLRRVDRSGRHESWQGCEATGTAGPVDPKFSILSVQHLDGRPLAVLGNYGLHYIGGYEGNQNQRRLLRLFFTAHGREDGCHRFSDGLGSHAFQRAPAAM